MGLRRPLEMATTLLGVTLLAFFLIRVAPGDPVLLLIGERGSDPEQYREMVVRLGLDNSLIVQYLQFVVSALQGDLGVSVVSQQSVIGELLARWPATIELGVSALLIACLLGVPAGVIAAVYRNSVADFLIMSVSIFGYSIPVFWWGLVLIMCFSIGLDITPVAGRIDILYDIPPVTGFMLMDTLAPQVVQEYGFSAFGSALGHLVLPALTMATIPLAVFARTTRSSMLEVLSEDYVRTARAKGLSEFRVIWRHAFRNALIPIVTVGGVLFVTTVITGAILTETIFAWPGVGRYIVNSVYARDYPVIQASILLIGIFVVLVNGLIDYLYGAINPAVGRRDSAS
ncbi:ABC transporter permease [uncultured Microbulbifer sp.]|uniref:ABC transporter permease n=1 Tax=uncultured Microbulbifer sp. TaxID=348147 RepID=UPI0026146691|nr:ABC transporter permease [uncultured Microbulbifer sp.]